MCVHSVNDKSFHSLYVGDFLKWFAFLDSELLLYRRVPDLHEVYTSMPHRKKLLNLSITTITMNIPHLQY